MRPLHIRPRPAEEEVEKARAAVRKNAEPLAGSHVLVQKELWMNVQTLLTQNRSEQRVDIKPSAIVLLS